MHLQGVPGWPITYGLGCAAYQFNRTHVQLLPFELRHRLLMHGDPESFYRSWQHRLPGHHGQPYGSPRGAITPAAVSSRTGYQTAVPTGASFPVACGPEHGNLDAAHCILRALSLGASMLSLLTEAPYHYRLKEHTVHPARTRLKLGGTSGQFGFDPDTGQIAVVDTDHIHESGAPAPTAAEQASPGRSLQDLVYAFSNSVLSPTVAYLNQTRPAVGPIVPLLPQLADLAEEIGRRHLVLRAGVPAGGAPTAQLSFSCLSAWLTAFAATVPPSLGTHTWPAVARTSTAGGLHGLVSSSSWQHARPPRAPTPDILRVVINDDGHGS